MKIYALAVIGAGPAGIAAACEAYAMGLHNVVLIEKGQNHSGTIRSFYKDGKRVDKDWQGQKIESSGTITFFDGTKESTLDFFDSILKKHEIDSRFSEEVEKIVN